MLTQNPPMRSMQAPTDNRPITIPERQDIPVLPRNMVVMKTPNSSESSGGQALQISEEQMRNAIKTQEQSRLAQNSMINQQRHNPSQQQQMPQQQMPPQQMPQQQMRPMIPQMQARPPAQQMQQAQFHPMHQQPSNGPHKLAPPAQMPLPHPTQVKQDIANLETLNEKTNFLATLKQDIKFPIVIFVLVAVLTYPTVTQMLGKYVPGMLNTDSELTAVGVLVRALFIAIFAMVAKYLVK